MALAPMIGRQGTRTRAVVQRLLAVGVDVWVSSGELARQVGIKTTSMSQCMSTLVRDGYLLCRKNSMRRAEYCLTEAGVAAYRQAMAEALAVAEVQKRKAESNYLPAENTMSARCLHALMRMQPPRPMTRDELLRAAGIPSQTEDGKRRSLSGLIDKAMQAGLIATVAIEASEFWVRYVLGPRAGDVPRRLAATGRTALVDQAMAIEIAVRAGRLGSKLRPHPKARRSDVKPAKPGKFKRRGRAALAEMPAIGADPAETLDPELQALRLRQLAWQPLPGSTAAKALAALETVKPGELLESIHIAHAIGLDDPRDIDVALGPAVLADRVRAYPAKRDVRRTVYGLVRGPSVQVMTTTTGAAA